MSGFPPKILVKTEAERNHGETQHLYLHGAHQSDATLQEAPHTHTPTRPPHPATTSFVCPSPQIIPHIPARQERRPRGFQHLTTSPSQIWSRHDGSEQQQDGQEPPLGAHGLPTGLASLLHVSSGASVPSPARAASPRSARAPPAEAPARFPRARKVKQARQPAPAGVGARRHVSPVCTASLT